MPEQIQAFFYKQLFHKQRQVEIGKKIEQTLRLNFRYLTVTYILCTRYHPEIIGDILRNMQKSKRLFINEITRLIIMKIKMKMKNRSHRYGKNGPRSKHGHKHSK